MGTNPFFFKKLNERPKGTSPMGLIFVDGEELLTDHKKVARWTYSRTKAALRVDVFSKDFLIVTIHDQGKYLSGQAEGLHI